MDCFFKGKSWFENPLGHNGLCDTKFVIFTWTQHKDYACMCQDECLLRETMDQTKNTRIRKRIWTVVWGETAGEPLFVPHPGKVRLTDYYMNRNIQPSRPKKVLCEGLDWTFFWTLLLWIYNIKVRSVVPLEITKTDHSQAAKTRVF